MLRIILALTPVFLVMMGCGSPSSGPQTVPVSGTVLMDGSPVEGATVQFIHEQFSSVGKTDASGKYSLQPGAVVGDNRVNISKFSVPAGMSGSPDGEPDEGQMMAMASDPTVAVSKHGPKQLIPSMYSNPLESTLMFGVPESGSESADFSLTSK